MADKRMKAQEEALKLKFELRENAYLHFKGGIYMVDEVSVHSETAEIMVIYHTWDDPMKSWCRPLEMFLSDVDHEKYPDVQQEKRFEKISFVEAHLISQQRKANK